MDEVQPLSEPSRRQGLARILTVALALVLIGDVALLLRGGQGRAPAPEEDPRVRAERLLDEARVKSAGGADPDGALQLLGQAIEASPTLAEARLLRIEVALPIWLERRAVLDASPLLDRARIASDPTIDGLRTTMLSDAAALGATTIGEEDRAEVAALEAFLTRKPVEPGASPRIRVLRAWQLLLDGKARQAMKECDLPELPAEALFRWTLARSMLAASREGPTTGGLPDSARALLEALPPTTAVLLDLAEATRGSSPEILQRALAASPGEASILARLAVAEEEAGNLVQALVWAFQANEAAPDVAGLLLLRARLHARLGQVGPARETYDHARKWFPDRPDVLRARAAFLLKTGDADKALGDAERAAQYAPTEESYSVLCDALVGTGQADQAQKRKEVWSGASVEARGRVRIALGPRDQDVPIAGEIEGMEDGLEALYALSCGKFERAEQLAQKSTTPDGLEALARVRVVQGRGSEATELLIRSLASDPLRASSQALLGRVFIGLGESEEAARALARALEIDPTCAEAWRGKAELELTRGERQEALKALDLAVEHGRSDPEDLALRAEARLRDRDHERALPDIDRALAARPDRVPWLLLRAEIRLAANDAAGARADAERACSLAADSTSAWALFARAAVAQGDLQATETALGRTFALDPRNVPARIASARMALARSRREEARRDLDQALETSPDDADALHLRAKLAMEDTRWRQAATDLERFLDRHPSDTRTHEAKGWLELARRALRDR